MRSIFEKVVGFHKKCEVKNVKKCQNLDEMGPGWRWRAQIWSIWIENDLSVLKPSRGLGRSFLAQSDQNIPTPKNKRKSVYVLPMKLPINRFGRPI